MGKSKNSNIKPGMSLEEMLKVLPFNDLVEEGFILGVEAVAARTGYTPQHLRRLCADEKVDHIKQGNMPRYYFLPHHVNALLKLVPVKKA